jgi:N-dimethylarginine dimethylaminohydrolase
MFLSMERTLATRTRRLLMCEPAYFDVVYEINPWMHVGDPADTGRALTQWHRLRTAYEDAGHTVETVAPKHGLPDMVFAANSALVIDGVAFLARFRFHQRRGEEREYARWLRTHGFSVHVAQHQHEGEGDFVVMGDVILGGTGFRTEPEAHREAERVFGREVVTLQLVDPRFYHLDTALFALDRDQIVYAPNAFSDASCAELACRYPDAVLVDELDALAFGCNAFSDGHNVWLPAGAEHLAAALDARDFNPVPIDLSELRKAGGSVKCCTLELREEDRS